MTDIVERLRSFDYWCDLMVVHEAADEIERLRKELDDLYSERHLFAKQRADDIAEIERLRKIEAAYNSLVQAENDLLRAKRFVES